MASRTSAPGMFLPVFQLLDPRLVDAPVRQPFPQPGGGLDVGHGALQPEPARLEEACEAPPLRAPGHRLAVVSLHPQLLIGHAFDQSHHARV